MHLLYIYLLFFRLFSHIGYYRVLSRVLCTRQLCCAVLCLVVFDSLRPHGLQPARLLCPWNSPGKNIGVGCHALLQGIFPTQGSNPGLPHCSRFFTSWATREIHIRKKRTLKSQVTWDPAWIWTITSVFCLQASWSHLIFSSLFRNVSTCFPKCLVCLHAQLLSHVRLFGTPETVAHQAPLDMGFPGQNTGVGCHFLLQYYTADPY